MRQDNTTGQAPVVIELWADLGCPWCYLGKHRLQQAIAARPDAERFEVKIRSFELHPEFSRVPEAIDTALIRAYGDGAPAVMQAERDFQSLARGEGLVFELDRLSANTFEVHRVTHYADGSGKGLEFFSRVQDQLFAGEVNPYAADTLASLAESLGLSGARVREILAGDEYASAIHADIEEGTALGVRGVPFTVFDRRIAVSGAQTVAGYAQALDEALAGSLPEATV